MRCQVAIFSPKLRSSSKSCLLSLADVTVSHEHIMILLNFDSIAAAACWAETRAAEHVLLFTTYSCPAQLWWLADCQLHSRSPFQLTLLNCAWSCAPRYILLVQAGRRRRGPTVCREQGLLIYSQPWRNASGLRQSHYQMPCFHSASCVT